MQGSRHGWDMAPREAIELQKKLRGSVRIEHIRTPIRTIAGADVSLDRFGTDLYAGIVLLSYPGLEPLGSAVAKVKASFPYIPGLLSFREIPGLLECLKRLRVTPDLIVVDGQGIAHPRRLGIASHLGAITGVATVGCAKSRLYGSYREPTTPGKSERIEDPKTGELLGYAYKSKRGAKPVLVSPGYGVTADEALEIIERCVRGFRLPEPTRLAHELVNAFRREEKKAAQGLLGATSRD